MAIACSHVHCYRAWLDKLLLLLLSTKQENTKTKKPVLTTHFTKEFTVQFAVVCLPYKQDSLKLH